MLAIRNYIDTDTRLNHEQSLRFALAATASASFSASVASILNLSVEVFIFYIITSIVSVFFSYGKTLVSQTLMQIVGIVSCAGLCFVGLLLSPFPWLAGIYLVVISCVGYFYSTINTGSLLIVKLSLVPVSFCVLSVMHVDMHYASQVWLAIMAGGFSGIMANTLMFAVSAKQPLFFLEKKWTQEVSGLLSKLSVQCCLYPTQSLQRASTAYTKKLFVTDPEHALSVETQTDSLIKFIDMIEATPALLYEVGPLYEQLFQAINQAIITQDISFCEEGHKKWLLEVGKLRKKHYFEHLPISIRRYYAEILFVTEQLVHELLWQLNPARVEGAALAKKTRRASFKALLVFYVTAIKQQTVFFHHGGRLSTQAKIAMRAALAMGVAYIYAIIFNNPYSSWVILTANLVLMVHHGDTIKRAFDRVAGHLVGFVVAMLLSYVLILFSSPFVYVPIIVFFIAYYFLKNYFVYGIFLMVGMLYLYGSLNANGFSEFNALNFLSIRLLDMLAGSVIALVASYFIFKDSGEHHFHQNNKRVINKMRDYLRHMKHVEADDVPQTQQKPWFIDHDIQEIVALNKMVLNNFSFEPLRYRMAYSLYVDILMVVQDLVKAMGTLMKAFSAGRHNCYQYPALKKQLDHCIDALILELQRLSAWCDELDSLSAPQAICRYPEATLSMLYFDTEKSIETAFDLVDTKKMGAHVLVQYLGLMQALQRIIISLQRATVLPVLTDNVKHK